MGVRVRADTNRRSPAAALSFFLFASGLPSGTRGVQAYVVLYNNNNINNNSGGYFLRDAYFFF